MPRNVEHCSTAFCDRQTVVTWQPLAMLCLKWLSHPLPQSGNYSAHSCERERGWVPDFFLPHRTFRSSSIRGWTCKLQSAFATPLPGQTTRVRPPIRREVAFVPNRQTIPPQLSNAILSGSLPNAAPSKHEVPWRSSEFSVKTKHDNLNPSSKNQKARQYEMKGFDIQKTIAEFDSKILKLCVMNRRGRLSTSTSKSFWIQIQQNQLKLIHASRPGVFLPISKLPCCPAPLPKRVWIRDLRNEHDMNIPLVNAAAPMGLDNMIPARKSTTAALFPSIHCSSPKAN